MPSISLTFNTFEQYYDNLFQSGHDGTTYAPYHSPDSDDPIPAKSRGLYFNGHMYLKSIKKVSMNYENSFLIWAMPQNEGFNFWNSPSILLFSQASGSYLLTDTETWIRYNTYLSLNITAWTFYTFTISFASGVCTSKI